MGLAQKFDRNTVPQSDVLDFDERSIDVSECCLGLVADTEFCQRECIGRIGGGPVVEIDWLVLGIGIAQKVTIDHLTPTHDSHDGKVEPFVFEVVGPADGEVGSLVTQNTSVLGTKGVDVLIDDGGAAISFKLWGALTVVGSGAVGIFDVVGTMALNRRVFAGDAVAYIARVLVIRIPLEALVGCDVDLAWNEAEAGSLVFLSVLPDSVLLIIIICVDRIVNEETK